MSTKAQTKANRKNSQKSTGPKTAEGKAVISRNAVKHDLFFTAEAVMTGENPADYEAYHDQFLAELAPYGMIETMLAERIISLSWWLQRADRMQNQVIDVMIARDEPSPLSKRMQRMLPKSHIDNRPQKTIHNLKKYQLMRHIQLAEANKPKPAQSFLESFGFEAATRHTPTEKNGDLKKQSQYAPALIGATSLVKEDYGNISFPGSRENKAKQSQSRAPALSKRAAIGTKAVAAATG